VLSPAAPRNRPRNCFKTWRRTLALALLAVAATIQLAPSRLSAQGLPATIGRIEGNDVIVTTREVVEMNDEAMVVASGSEVTLRSGNALLLLDTGGEIRICGPAHFTLLMSAGAVTLALDYGRVHPSLDAPETLTIYTPTIIATPVAILGARRDMTLGLDQNGEMCILAARGAMRLEPQFPGQGLLVPQGSVVSLGGGQIESFRSDASSCSCDFPQASVEHTRPSSSREISVLSQPLQPEQKKPNAGAPAAPVQEPVYTVLMPPLSFDANSPAPPPDPSPETILLVREVRVRPTIVFHGHVNPAPVQAVAPPPPVPPPPAPTGSARDDRAGKTQLGFLARARNLFRKLIGKEP
jgi:hypothetical protein